MKSWLTKTNSQKIFGIGIAGLACIIFIVFFYRETKKILATPAHSWIVDQNADCAIVLTGSAGRVREGFDLLARKQIKKLIISGAHPGAKLREIFPQRPFYGGIRNEDVILEKQSGTTYGNAIQSLALVEALQCRDTILVTTRIHMYRALRTFQKVFPEDYTFYPRAVVHRSYDPSRRELWVESMKSLFYSIWTY